MRRICIVTHGVNLSATLFITYLPAEIDCLGLACV